jgi:hypothetical protein
MLQCPAGVVLSDACKNLGMYGQNLASQGYKGLLIGFSWLSYNSVDSYLYYASPYSFPPTHEYGTIRDNVEGLPVGGDAGIADKPFFGVSFDHNL